MKKVTKFIAVLALSTALGETSVSVASAATTKHVETCKAKKATFLPIWVNPGMHWIRW